jgi:HAD superfamily hydrolase (TIGR01549 family)
MNYKAIIFDMDGVLVDTEQFYYDRRKVFLNGKGLDISHIEPGFFVGGNMKQVWQRILGDDYDKWDIPALQAAYDHYKETHPLPYTELLFPDAKPLVEAARVAGLKTGLASATMKSQILDMLRENGMTDDFQVVLSGQDFEESKPNPEIYLTAMADLGVAADEVLIIEDSTKGIQAGKSAGATVWAIRDTRFGLDQSGADRIIENLTEARALLGL